MPPIEDCFGGFSEYPRAVLGLNDISARVALKRMLKTDVMTFATSFSLYEEMEKNVESSFLERGTWDQLMALKKNRETNNSEINVN